MSRSAFVASTAFFALILSSRPAAGQAAVEAGLGAAASATGAAGARGVSSSVNGVLRSLDKTLKSAGAGPSKTQSPSKVTEVVTAPDKPVPAPAIVAAKPHYEDAAGIQKGMAYEELLRRFGPPVMEFAGSGGAKTMTYFCSGGALQVEFQGEKVTSVTKTASGA